MSANEWKGEGAVEEGVWVDDESDEEVEISLEAELTGLGGAASSGAPSSSDHVAERAEEALVRPVSAFTSAFTNAKPGMEGVDKDKVKRVVHQISKDSSHFHNETRKENAVEERIRAMQKRWAELGRGGVELSAVRDAVERRVAVLEAGRDLSHTWIHVDMDAFFAAVHELERPELKTLPVAVGGVSMISTANYEARKHGVRSAMPGFIAKKLCPQLVFVTPDFEKYTRYAALTREVFKRYDCDFDAASLDEAYLEISDHLRTRPSGMTPTEVADEIRAAVQENTGGLTCSAGVAPTRRLAKVCSDMNKPNGTKVVGPDRGEVMRLLEDLPTRKIGGIGKVQERVLAAFGIVTCSELFRERVLVAALFTPSAAAFLLETSLGVGSEHRPPRAPEGAPQRKSLSQERTFTPTADRRVLEAKMTSLAQEVAAGLIKEGLRARTVTVKLKRATFEIVSRQMALQGGYTDDVDTLVAAGLRLLRGESSSSLSSSFGPVRLLGFKVSHFEGGEDDKDAAHIRATRSAAGQMRIDKLLLTSMAGIGTCGFEGTCGGGGSEFSGEVELYDEDDDKVEDVRATYLCLECGRNVPVTSRDEHGDWHFARALQRVEDNADAAPSRAALVSSPGGRRGGGSGGLGGGRKTNKSKKGSRAQTTLYSMLGPTKRNFK